MESAEALRARDDLWAGLGTAERAYLGACRAAEDAARDRELAAARELVETERRGRKRAMVGLAAASLAALVAIGASWWAWHQQGVAENARKEAERQGQMARLSYETAIKSLAGMVGDIQRRIPLGSTTSYSGNVERELISGTTAQQLAEFPLNAFNELDRLRDFRQDASLNRGRAALFGSIREIFSQTGALDKALEAARLEVQARRYLFQVQDDQGSARDLVVSLVGSARLLHQFSGTINQEWRILVDEAREIADRVSNTLEFADRRAWRVQMSQVYSAMSDGYLLGREFQIANDFAQLAFEQIDELADDPDFGLSRRRAIALGRLSDTFVALNVQDKAIDLMERNVKLSRELVERTRGNPSGTQHIDARRGLSIALERMSFLELWRSGGNPYTTYNLAKEAINYLPSLRGMDGVQLCFASSESLNPNWLQTRFYSNIQYLRALLIFQDDLEKREELLKVSKCMLDIIERLRLINFSSPATERNEAVAALYRARALRIGGDFRGSANYYVHCLQRRFPSFYWLRSAGDQDILRLCADELVIVTGP